MPRAMSDTVDQDINTKIRASPFFTIMAVESTDIANKKRMAIYAKILDSEMKPKPIFLNIMEYED